MRFVLKLYRLEPEPIDEIAIMASDEQEARELARLHVLMARDVKFAAAERDGRECFRLDRRSAGAAF